VIVRELRLGRPVDDRTSDPRDSRGSLSFVAGVGPRDSRERFETSRARFIDPGASPRGPPTASLARRFVAALRSAGSLIRSLARTISPGRSNLRPDLVAGTSEIGLEAEGPGSIAGGRAKNKTAPEINWIWAQWVIVAYG